MLGLGFLSPLVGVWEAATVVPLTQNTRYQVTLNRTHFTVPNTLLVLLVFVRKSRHFFSVPSVPGLEVPSLSHIAIFIHLPPPSLPLPHRLRRNLHMEWPVACQTAQEPDLLAPRLPGRRALGHNGGRPDGYLPALWQPHGGLAWEG